MATENNEEKSPGEQITATIRAFARGAGKLINFVVISSGILALVIAGYFTHLHYEFVRPVEQVVAKHPDDLAFIGGMLAGVCLVPDALTMADDLKEVQANAKELQSWMKKCGDISNLLDCGEDVVSSVFNPKKRAHAKAVAQKAMRVYRGVRKMLAPAHDIATALPAYDKKSQAVKTIITKVIAHLQGMSAIELVHLIEEEDYPVPSPDHVENLPDDWAIGYDPLDQMEDKPQGTAEERFEAELKPYEKDAEAWVKQAENYYGFDDGNSDDRVMKEVRKELGDDSNDWKGLFEIIHEGVTGAKKDGTKTEAWRSLTATIMLWDFRRSGLDEVLQRAPAFKKAREQGCLQGASLAEAVDRFLMANVEQLDRSFSGTPGICERPPYPCE